MREIKVGEYVRTSVGKIYKLTEKIQEQIENYPGFLQHIEQKSIVKHSPNIIDLIEIGDYVNGSRVENVDGFDKDGNDIIALGVIENDLDYAYGVFLTDLNIKSIVTKEQFQSVEYRLEE